MSQSTREQREKKERRERKMIIRQKQADRRFGNMCPTHLTEKEVCSLLAPPWPFAELQLVRCVHSTVGSSVRSTCYRGREGASLLPTAELTL